MVESKTLHPEKRLIKYYLGNENIVYVKVYASWQLNISQFLYNWLTWMVVEGETEQINFSWDTPGICFTIRHHKNGSRVPDALIVRYILKKILLCFIVKRIHGVSQEKIINLYT